MKAFASAAVRQMIAPQWRGNIAALFIILTETDILLAWHVPAQGQRPDAMFVVAGLFRLVAVLSISVALLRIAAGSTRKRWAPDGGFWLFFALSLIELALEAVAGRFIVRPNGLGPLLAIQAFALLLFTPFSVWSVAAAVETPLAWRPAPWFRGIGRWLPPLAVLMLPVVLIAAAHADASSLLIRIRSGPIFWLLAVTDGLVSTLVVAAELAIRVTAYRLVARP